MNSRNIDLYESIAERVVCKLRYRYTHAGFNYTLISSELRNLIKEEIIKALTSLELTAVQQSIVEQCVYDVGEPVGGYFKTESYFNLLTDAGIKCTGLTQVYFDHLKFDHLKLNILYEDTEERQNCATFDNLKGCFEEREKRIISIFCSELAKFATYEQKILLWKEKDRLDNQPVMKMRQPRNIMSAFLYGKEGDDLTTSAKLYFNTVLDLFCTSYPYWNLIGPALLGHSIPEDVSKYIVKIGLFNYEKSKLACTLPLINKATADCAAVYKKEKEEYSKMLRK